VFRAERVKFYGVEKQRKQATAEPQVTAEV